LVNNTNQALQHLFKNYVLQLYSSTITGAEAATACATQTKARPHAANIKLKMKNLNLALLSLQVLDFPQACSNCSLTLSQKFYQTLSIKHTSSG